VRSREGTADNLFVVQEGKFPATLATVGAWACITRSAVLDLEVNQLSLRVTSIYPLPAFREVISTLMEVSQDMSDVFLG